MRMTFGFACATAAMSRETAIIVIRIMDVALAVGSFHQGSKDFEEGVRLAHEAKVGRMRAIDGPFAVVAEQLCPGQVVQMLDACFLQPIEGFLEGGPILVVVLPRAGK